MINFANSLDPDQDQWNVRTDLDGVPKRICRKKYQFSKKNQQIKKQLAKSLVVLTAGYVKLVSVVGLKLFGCWWQLLSSADNLYKQFEPRSGLSGFKLFDTDPERFLEKVNLKKISWRQKKAWS